MKTVRYQAGKRICRVMLGAAMALSLCLGTGGEAFGAAKKTLGISQARSLALAGSEKYRQIQSKILLKEVSYRQAVKSLELKRKNKTTFRWSPVLSFSFPSALNMAEESEYVYKPTKIQTEISALKHELTDTKYEIYEEASNLYVSVYAYQEKIAFQEGQLEEMEKTLAKNQARLLVGTARQEDVSSVKRGIKSLTASLSENKRKFENDKAKLGKMIHMDVSGRYVFSNPYVETELPRAKLPQLISHTLFNDQSFYEAKLSTRLSLLQLNTNYDLMQKQYGSKMGMISSYVQQIKKGDQADGGAFKRDYDKFLQEIDKPWTGKYRILFFRFPKEWFKGEIDGIRYIEDEPYALYENALEYQDTLAEQNALEKEIEQQVRENFETQISARNSYEALMEQSELEKENLEKLKIMNSLGTCPFEEYTQAQEQYEELLADAMEALKLYSTLLYSYDRLTCGAVSAYLKGLGIDAAGAKGADSYIVAEEDAPKGAKYYFTHFAEDSVFELGIWIPEGFETDITHFELWIDGAKIGERTEIGKKLRHLALTEGMAEKIVIRLYENGTFAADCEIEAGSYEGDLEMPGNYVVAKEESGDRQVAGTYEITLNRDTSLAEITMDFETGQGVSYYTLADSGGKPLFREEPSGAGEPFRYLAVLSESFDEITVRCYDSEKNFLFDAYFDSEKNEIYRENR